MIDYAMTRGKRVPACPIDNRRAPLQNLGALKPPPQPKSISGSFHKIIAAGSVTTSMDPISAIA